MEDSIEDEFERYPPWVDRRKQPKSLHDEIVAFDQFLQATTGELTQREQVISRVRTLVKSKYPVAKIDVFGSCATKLFLPSSDIDCVLSEHGVGAGTKGILKNVQAVMQRSGLFRKIVVLSRAKVPIIKSIDAQTKLCVDICVDQLGGLDSAQVVINYLQEFKQLRPLVLVIKYFLTQKDLNETFTGGVGSYLTTLMVVSFLQVWKNNVGMHLDNYGVLLIEFFKLYGKDFNYNSVGLLPARGCYYQKADRRRIDQQKPFLLSCEDPNDPENDVGRNSYQILRVREEFAAAYDRLVNSDPSDYPSFLARILDPDDSLESRVGLSKPLREANDNEKKRKRDHQSSEGPELKKKKVSESNQTGEESKKRKSLFSEAFERFRGESKGQSQNKKPKFSDAFR